MTVRLVSPMGVVVSVSEEKAARLGSGWVPYVADQSAPTTKPERKPRVKKTTKE